MQSVDATERFGVAVGRPGVASRLCGAAFGTFALAMAWIAPAAAQDAAIVGDGNAVVTGFSGYLVNEAPADEDPFDYVTVNPDGTAAEVVDLSALGPQGQLSDAPKTFVVPASQTGQVFGVALDNAPQPSIYLAATSVYGLSIYLPDDTGTIKRIRTGAPGAQFVPGQFGPPEYGGSPGAVWRVDGQSGEVNLFASIDTQGVGSLGGLAFDPVSQQLFVADRTTGIIHRFGLDGTEGGTYDHGVEGRPAAGLSALPPSAGTPIDIGSEDFDTENPSTWGFAPPARRVFALAVRDSRLYYSIAQGPQVWSVGISDSGAVGADPRVEVEVPSLQDGIEITSISFDGDGNMYLAERGATTGDYSMTELAAPGASRVLRYVPKDDGDPNPGYWRLEPDQYAIGMPDPYNNADGGVALGYGYQDDGSIDGIACRQTVWSTGERLLDPGDPSVPEDSYPAVDGIQGNDISLIEPDNMPPVNSWFVDYDDQPGSTEYRGFMGGIAIYSPCAGEGETYVPPPPPPPVVTCPPGTVFSNGECVVVPVCPPGTSYRDGNCIYLDCPPGFVRYQGQCVPPPRSCPPGFAFYDGKCVPLNCPPGMRRMPNGQCICPVDNIYYDGRCVPPRACPPGMFKYPNGICWCPAGTHFQNGRCVPNLIFCPRGFITINGRCVPTICPPGYVKAFNGACVPIIVRCSPIEILINGRCFPRVCPRNQFLGNDGRCHPKFVQCGPNQKLHNGKCVPNQANNNLNNKPNQPQCGPNQVLKNGKCVPKQVQLQCGPNQVVKNGKCVAKQQQPQCGPNQVLKNGKCVPKQVQLQCGPNQVVRNGKCVPKQNNNNNNANNNKNKNNNANSGGNCGPGKVRFQGSCVPACGKGEVRNKNGRCVPKRSELDNVLTPPDITG